MLLLSLAVTTARAEGLLKAAAARPAEGNVLLPPPPPRSGEPNVPADVVEREEPDANGALAAAANDPDGHQLWLVSTRSLPHCSHLTVQAPPSVRRYRRGPGWSPSSVEELAAASGPSFVTSVLVHGNDTDSRLALSKGWEVYRTLVRKAPPGQCVRLIVWSWPSDHIRGSFREDARIKAQRTNVEAYYLASFLDRLHGENVVSLVGYSFGARVITGALHLLGGGVLEGRVLEPSQRSRPPMHAVLLAAAVDRDWLLPGRRHGRALGVVDRMVVLTNPQDRVLKWYRFLAPRHGEQALGATGLAAHAILAAERKKVVQIDVSHAVGNKHGWTSYIGSPMIVERLHREALVEPARKSAARSQAGGS